MLVRDVMKKNVVVIGSAMTCRQVAEVLEKE